MSIFSRMSDIINSNINAILDKAEDPEKMVRLIIQEMEEALVEVRSTSARAIADKKELSRRQEYLDADASEWERKAEVAISKGRDDLAKGALVERNKAAEAAEALSYQAIRLTLPVPTGVIGLHIDLVDLLLADAPQLRVDLPLQAHDLRVKPHNLRHAALVPPDNRLPHLLTRHLGAKRHDTFLAHAQKASAGVNKR